MRYRFFVWILLSVLAAAALGTGGLYWLARRAEPVYDGTRRIAGLQAPVRVRFGPHAVPSIAAENLRDLMLAQGYVVAAERMWQMDLMRRLASGRLAELFGPDALAVDRFFRTIGLAQEARRALADLHPSDRALVSAYAAGVNVYRDRARGRRPLEYLIAGLEPAPWTPEDSLVIGAYMAWTQSFNLRGELSFLRLARRIGPERARELFPADEGLPAPPVPPELVDYLASLPRWTSGRGDTGLEPRRLASTLYGLPLPGPASNAWAVTGARTATGDAMLANDPHLAPSAPGIWYELELAAPGLHVAGVALPGVPLILIGHNEHLAWGFTSVLADTQDLFIERLTPDGTRVLRSGGGAEPVETRSETIRVRGADPAELRVRRTSRGVVIDPILGPVSGTIMDLPELGLPGLLVLRRNRDLPDRSFAAVRGLCQSRTLDEARQAGLGFRHVAMNLMLAHRDGGIAWQVTGLLPERGRGSGAFPMPGWIDGYAWRGLASPSLNPSLADPPGDTLVTANNRTVPPDYPLSLGHCWMGPHRAQRIKEALDASPALTPERMARIQADRLSLAARHAQAALRRQEMELRAIDPLLWGRIQTQLLDWDGVMDGESRSAALFALLEPALYRALYGDELGEDLDLLMSMATVAYSPLQEVLRTGRSGFWDDVRTPQVETPAEIWARAIRAAESALERQARGASSARLRDIRSLRFPHAFDAAPLLGDLFSVGPVGVGGGTDTVDVLKTLPQEPGRGLFSPSMRVVATPADWGLTRGTLPLGQSGHRFSPYRTDQLADWLAVRGHAWPWNGPAEPIGELRLLPADD